MPAGSDCWLWARLGPEGGPSYRAAWPAALDLCPASLHRPGWVPLGRESRSISSPESTGISHGVPKAHPQVHSCHIHSIPSHSPRDLHLIVSYTVPESRLPSCPLSPGSGSHAAHKTRLYAYRHHWGWWVVRVPSSLSSLGACLALDAMVAWTVRSAPPGRLPAPGSKRETGEGRLIAPPTPGSDCMQPSVLLMHVWLSEGGTGTPPSRMAVGLCGLGRRSSVRGLGQLGSTHLTVAEPWLCLAPRADPVWGAEPLALGMITAPFRPFLPHPSLQPHRVWPHHWPQGRQEKARLLLVNGSRSNWGFSGRKPPCPPSFLPLPPPPHPSQNPSTSRLRRLPDLAASPHRVLSKLPSFPHCISPIRSPLMLQVEGGCFSS